MLIDDLTSEEIKELQRTIETTEEQDEYEEYNNKLEGTSYNFGYAGLQRKVFKGNKEEIKNISNFLPLPIKKIYIDDGREAKGYLQLKGVLIDKKVLPDIKVDYGELDNMKWINNAKWDLKPRIYPPKANHKEYAYDVLHYLSKDIPKETILSIQALEQLMANLYIYIKEEQ